MVKSDIKDGQSGEHCSGKWDKLEMEKTERVC